MSSKLGKGDVHFQPKWGQVLLSLLVIAGAVWLFWWCIWGTPLTGAWKVVVAVLVILLGCFLCFSAGMNLRHVTWMRRSRKYGSTSTSSIPRKAACTPGRTASACSA